MLQALSLAVLVATSVTLGAINTITSFAIYENSGSYTGVAVWLLVVAIAVIIFHVVMIFIRILYITSIIEKNFSEYAITVSIHLN